MRHRINDGVGGVGDIPHIGEQKVWEVSVLAGDPPRPRRRRLHLDRPSLKRREVISSIDVGDEVYSSIPDRLRYLDPRTKQLLDEQLTAQYLNDL